MIDVLPHYESARFRAWLYVLVLGLFMLTCSSQAIVYYIVKTFHTGKKP